MSKPAKTFEDLIVWQKAHRFVLEIYRSTVSFPAHESYCLTSQFRRAAVSVPANIAEGFKRTHQKDKVRFLNIAQGSLEECRYYIILAKDLNYCNCKGLQDSLEEAGKLLESCKKTIESKA